MEEKILIEKAGKGDQTAFRVLMEKYKNQIYALSYRLTGNHEDSEDISQEVVIKVYRGLPDFGYKSSFSTWIYTITRNTCLDFFRKNRQECTSLEELDFMLSDSRQNTEEDALRNQKLSKVISIINTLPKEQKQILILREIDGFSYEDIADIMGIALGTVKSRLARAKAYVREKFED